MHRFAAALLIFMSGCGGNSDEASSLASLASFNNHGFGFAFDAMGKDGLKLRQPGATNSDAEFMEAIARTVGFCSGITAPPPPFVIVVPRDSLGPPNIGLYDSAPPLILLDEDWVSIAYPHEVLHFQLEFSAGDRDREHKDPRWACVFTGM